MKITVEAVSSYITSIGTTFFGMVYLNHEFMGCVGITNKLEFETKNSENEIEVIDGYKNAIKNKIRFVATEDVQFWIGFSGALTKHIEIYGKGNDYKLISK